MGGMLVPEPLAGTFSARGFKSIYPKQKPAAPITEASQHYRARALRWSSRSLQSLMGCSGVRASASHCLSDKQGRNKSTGKSIRGKEDPLSALLFKLLAWKGLLLFTPAPGS